jgi:hypothetical protein
MSIFFFGQKIVNVMSWIVISSLLEQTKTKAMHNKNIPEEL